MRTTWVMGNWKMNGDLASNAALLESVIAAIPLSDSAKVAVCVPFPYLAQVQSIVDGSALLLGAQDVSEFKEGAYTGEVSAKMLKECGVSLVLVGHSERRSLFGETDVVVAKKAKTLLKLVYGGAASMVIMKLKLKIFMTLLLLKLVNHLKI